MNRRSFAKRTFAAVAGISAAISGTLSGAAKRRTRKGQPEELSYWVLDPEHGAGESCPTDPDDAHAAGGGCHGCRACHMHAKNKLFATEEAANSEVGRAHPGCRCLAKEGGSLPQQTWTALFGRTNSPQIPSVDVRHPSTRRILDRVA